MKKLFALFMLMFAFSFVLATGNNVVKNLKKDYQVSVEIQKQPIAGTAAIIADLTVNRKLESLPDRESESRHKQIQYNTILFVPAHQNNTKRCIDYNYRY